LSDHSRDLGDEGIVIETTSSVLSEIMRPVFHNYNSNSHIATLSSSFLTSAFVFPIAESMHVIDESIRGYIQFSPLWKNNEQPLDFIPLEKLEDYYPEEIEEEVILPYYAPNNPAAIQRKVTSYATNLAQRIEAAAIDGNNNINKNYEDDSSGSYLHKAKSRKSATGNEQASYKTTRQKKSLKKTTFKEDGQSSKRRDPRLSTETKKYPVHKATKDLNSEDITSFATISPSKMKPPFKRHSDMQHIDQPHIDHSEKKSTQLTPAAIDLSQNKKKASSSSSSSTPTPSDEYAVPSQSKMKPPFKRHSDMQHIDQPHIDHSEKKSTQLTPAAIDLSQNKKKASSSSSSSTPTPSDEYAVPSSLYEQKETRKPQKTIVDPALLAKESITTSIFPRMLKPLRINHHKDEDDDNTRLLAKSSTKRVSNLGDRLPINDNNDSSSTTDRQSKIENHESAKIQGIQKDISQNRLSYESGNVLPKIRKRESVSHRSDNNSKNELKTTKESNIKHDFALVGLGTNNKNQNHDSIILPSKRDKGTTDENNKSSIHAPASINDLQRRKDPGHKYKDPDSQYSKLVSRVAVNQREQVISSTVDSSKIHPVDDVLPIEYSVMSPIDVKNISKLRKLKNPTIKTISDTGSATSDRSEMIAEAAKVDTPAITINKLDVTVVGDTDRNSTDTMSPLMEPAESSGEISHYFSEYGIESLNKSYLWKYKVKF
jgi:hypothetical protein